MTKAELVDRVADRIHLTKKDTERVVNLVFGSIMHSLTQDEKVELRGFGSFRVRSRSSRSGRNPRTGEAVAIPPKNVPFFKAGKELREMVDQPAPAPFADEEKPDEAFDVGALAPADSEAYRGASESDPFF